VSAGGLIVMLDEGTPVPVADPFVRNGHRVIHFHEVLTRGEGVKDAVVAAMAIQNNAALIAVDPDLTRLVRRFGSSPGNDRFKSLNLIWLSCGPVMATKRIEQAMSFIEHEWEFACRKRARRLWIDIGQHRMTSYR
jgi:predicted nuclease of predicted toxin-antitoxin system